MGSDEWINLLSGTGDGDSAGPLVEAAAGELDRRMAADPQTEGRMVAILDRALARRIDGLTLATTKDALATYLGDDVAFLLVWLSEPNSMAERLEDFTAIASQPAANLVRSLMARYSQELRNAQESAGQPADEWKSLSQEAFLDQLTGKYTVRVRIEKYSGETVVLEASPNSALGLVKFVTRALGAIATPGLFDTTNLEEYFSDVEDFRSRLTAEADAEQLGSAAAEPGEPPGAPTTEPPELVH